jgi:Zn-dependent protease/CBS domain-containing protein
MSTSEASWVRVAATVQRQPDRGPTSTLRRGTALAIRAAPDRLWSIYGRDPRSFADAPAAVGAYGHDVSRRGSTLRIGRLAGVPIGVHPLWLVIVALITLALGRDYFPSEDPALGEAAAYLLGLASALTLFLGILLHELGHAVVARRHGLEVEEIDLWLLGGVARMTGEPDAPGDELRFALAGPAVTAVVLVAFGAVRLVAGDVLADWLRAFVDYQLYVNAAILVFNLLPAFPLDGGRVARSLLWRHMGARERATELAARVGRAFGIGLVVLGLVSFAGGGVGGLWLALVGGFLIVAAGAEAQGAAMERSFAGRTVQSLMTSPAATLRGDLTAEEAVVVGFARHLYSAFPVVDADDRVLGVIVIDDLRSVAPLQRARVTVAQLARRDPALLVAPDTPVTALLALPAFVQTGRAVVVDDERRPLGVVSVTDVQRRLRADALLPDRDSARRAA